MPVRVTSRRRVRIRGSRSLFCCHSSQPPCPAGHPLRAPLYTDTIPNLAALPLDLLKQVISEIEEMEKADALQSITRMNHAELNLNVLILGGPATGTMAARAQAAVIDPRGPVLPM